MHFDLSQHKQRGFSEIIVLIIVALVVAVGAAYYFGYDIGFEKAVKTTSSPTPNEITNYNPQGFTDFPVYPNATFIKKEEKAPCEGPESIFTICNATVYVWETKDDFEKVNSWYQGNKTENGYEGVGEWKWSGGAGQYDNPRSASGKSTYTKGGMDYNLWLDATADKTTIMLEIPN